MAMNRYAGEHAKATKATKTARKLDKNSRFRRAKAPEPAVEQWPSAFPNAPEDAAGVGRILSRGL